MKIDMIILKESLWRKILIELKTLRSENAQFNKEKEKIKKDLLKTFVDID